MSRTNVTQYDVIDFMRFPLIVLVTYAHSYSSVPVDFSLADGTWDMYGLARVFVGQILAKVPMPAFFAISGYLFFHNMEQWNWSTYIEKIKRRVNSLLVPYLLWNLLAAVQFTVRAWRMGRNLDDVGLNIFWVFHHSVGRQTDWIGHINTLTAPCNMPLWFLRDLIIVTLIAPAIYYILHRFGKWVLFLLCILYLSGIYAFTPGLSAYSIFFFSAGAFLSIHQLDPKALFMQVEYPVYAISILLVISMLFTIGTPIYSSVMLAFRITGAISAFCITYRLLQHGMHIPQLLTQSSFFIYLIHYVVFLSLINTAFLAVFGQSTCSLTLHYLLCPLLKIGIFVAIYAAYQKLKIIKGRLLQH